MHFKHFYKQESNVVFPKCSMSQDHIKEMRQDETVLTAVGNVFEVPLTLGLAYCSLMPCGTIIHHSLKYNHRIYNYNTCYITQTTCGNMWNFCFFLWDLPSLVVLPLSRRTSLIQLHGLAHAALVASMPCKRSAQRESFGMGRGSKATWFHIPTINSSPVEEICLNRERGEFVLQEIKSNSKASRFSRTM